MFIGLHLILVTFASSGKKEKKKRKKMKKGEEKKKEFFLKLWSKNPKSKLEQRHLKTQQAQLCEHTQFCGKNANGRRWGRKSLLLKN